MPIESIRWPTRTPASSRGRQADFIDFISTEITDATGPHTTLVNQWIKWLEYYRAPVNQPLRNTPYEGAANFMLPIIAIDADQLYAKFMQTIHATDNIWTVQPLNERWIDAAKPLQDFLTWLDSTVLKMFNVNERVINEMVLLGTGIYKTGWYYENRQTRIYGADGKSELVRRIKGRPFVDQVRLPDFLLPQNAYSIDPDEQGGASWVAQRIRISVEHLRWLAESTNPYLPNIDKKTLDFVLRFEESSRTDYDSAIQRLDYEKIASTHTPDFETDKFPASVSGTQPAHARYLREIELWEVHARFATGANDSQDDIVVWYHHPTRTILRDVYAYYDHGKRPFDSVRYFPGQGFYGIGICEQAEVFQLMQSDLFNFNWDGAYLANSRMIVTKSGQHISPGESIYPGKIWVVDDDVNKAFGVFPMADVYPSLPELQQNVQFLRERRTGIGDLQTGQIESLPSRTPATSMLSLLQEGNRRPDLTLKALRYRGLSVVGLRILQLCQQYMAQGTVDVGGQNLLKLGINMLGMPEGQFAALALTTPLESIEAGLGVSLTATSGSANKEVEKQNYLQLLQLSGQIGQQIIEFGQVATQFAGTPLGDTAQQTINGILKLAVRLLEQYDIKNIDEIIPSPPQAQGAGRPPGPTSVPPGPNGGSPGGAPPSSDPAGMAALFGGLGASA